MFSVELFRFHMPDDAFNRVHTVELEVPAILHPLDVLAANTGPYTGADAYAIAARVPVSCTAKRKLVVTIMPAEVKCDAVVGAYIGCIRRMGATSDNLWRSYVFIKWADADTWDQPLHPELGGGRMKTIWKYELPLHCENAPVHVLAVPPSFRPLSVQLQRGVPVIWAEVDVPSWTFDKDPDRDEDVQKLLTERVHVTRCATGRPRPESPGSYLGTYQCLDETCNKHVYLKWGDGTPLQGA